MGRALLVFVLAFLGSQSFVLSQETGGAAMAPKPPLVGPLPDWAAYTVSYTYSTEKKSGTSSTDADTDESGRLEDAEDSAQINRLQRAKVVKTGNIRHEEYTWSLRDGVKEAWILNNVGILTQRMKGKETLSVSYASEKTGYRSDFRELGWVSAELYQGIKTIDGVQCYFYFREAKSIKVSEYEMGDEVEIEEAQAWISVDTNLPIRALVGKQKMAYSYDNQPNAKLEIPKKQMKCLQDYADSVAGRRKRKPMVLGQ